MKRKYAVLLLPLAIIAGIAYMLSLQKQDTKTEIFGYVQENRTALEEFAAALMEGQMQDAAFDGRKAAGTTWSLRNRSCPIGIGFA